MSEEIINIINWETPLSNCKEVFFEKLVDVIDMEIVMSDQDEDLYDIFVENPGPYQVADETYLTNYWYQENKKQTGYTFIIENSNWIKKFPLLIYNKPKVKHYIIATADSCIEILTEHEPKITKRIK